MSRGGDPGREGDVSRSSETGEVRSHLVGLVAIAAEHVEEGSIRLFKVVTAKAGNTAPDDHGRTVTAGHRHFGLIHFLLTAGADDFVRLCLLVADVGQDLRRGLVTFHSNTRNLDALATAPEENNDEREEQDRYQGQDRTGEGTEHVGLLSEFQAWCK